MTTALKRCDGVPRLYLFSALSRRIRGVWQIFIVIIIYNYYRKRFLCQTWAKFKYSFVFFSHCQEFCLWDYCLHNPLSSLSVCLSVCPPPSNSRQNLNHVQREQRIRLSLVIWWLLFRPDITSLPDDLALSIKNQSIFYRSLNGGVPTVATRSSIVCVCTFFFVFFLYFFQFSF